MILTVGLFIDFQEILIILIVVVMLFGTKSLPEIARGLGHMVRQFNTAANDIKREILDPSVISNPIEKIKDEFKESIGDIEKEVKEGVKEMKNSFEPIEGTIKRNE